MDFLKRKVDRIQKEIDDVGLTGKQEWPYRDICHIKVSHHGDPLVRFRASLSDASFSLLMYPATPERSTRIVAGSPYCNRDSSYWIDTIMEENLTAIRRMGYRLGLIQERALPTIGRLKYFTQDIASFHLEGEPVTESAKQCYGPLAEKIVKVARGLLNKGTTDREKLTTFADLCWRAPLEGLSSEPSISFMVRKAELLFSDRIHNALEEEIEAHLERLPERNQMPAMA